MSEILGCAGKRRVLNGHGVVGIQLVYGAWCQLDLGIFRCGHLSGYQLVPSSGVTQSVS